MSTLAVARRDFLNVRRAKLVWAPVALYSLFMVLFFYGQSSNTDPDFHMVLFSLLGIGSVLVIPLIALVAAYLSVAGERESGTIKFTLGVPVDRAAVVTGKLLARSIVVVAGVLVSFVVGTIAAKVFVPGMAIAYGDYLRFIAITVLYATAYVAIAVGISAATSARSRAIAGSIAFFFVFNIGWFSLPISPMEVFEFVLEQLGRDPENYQHFMELIWSLSPTGAYLNTMDFYLPARIASQQAPVSTASDPFYIQPWFMLVILAAWVVVPLALGIRRFQKAQLG
ncbi:ABC transporter permease subunit [Halapricum salinum]|uniref:ABC transporter n=1 Tax=Halapricum salinum TaxID=1457250 RepID=A0A4D6HDT7_9EURY|nr:ABC transporter permease subunit [Halapricum salinum]QCC51212.1 ABC transporter [Halapricum salinum]